MEDKYFSTFFKELVVQENGLIVFVSDEFKETKEFMFLLGSSNIHMGKILH